MNYCRNMATKPRRICDVEGCESPFYARGWCRNHWRRWRRHGDPLGVAVRMRRVCDIEGCDRTHSGLGYCDLHLSRFKRHDDPLMLKQVPNGQGHTDPHGYISFSGKRAHRVVMEQMLGRALLPHENVHHKNGVRGDNRPENLELWVTVQPCGQRPADLVLWAKEILRRYDDE